MGESASGSGISRRQFAMMGAAAGAAVAAGAGGLTEAEAARRRQRRDRAERKNLELMGFDDLQARSAYQPWVEFNPTTRRWIACVVDRANAGMHILRATGRLAAIAGR